MSRRTDLARAPVKLAVQLSLLEEEEAVLVADFNAASKLRGNKRASEQTRLRGLLDINRDRQRCVVQMMAATQSPDSKRHRTKSPSPRRSAPPKTKGTQLRVPSMSPSPRRSASPKTQAARFRDQKTLLFPQGALVTGVASHAAHIIPKATSRQEFVAMFPGIDPAELWSASNCLALDPLLHAEFDAHNVGFRPVAGKPDTYMLWVMNLEQQKLVDVYHREQAALPSVRKEFLARHFAQCAAKWWGVSFDE